MAASNQKNFFDSVGNRMDAGARQYAADTSARATLGAANIHAGAEDRRTQVMKENYEAQNAETKRWNDIRTYLETYGINVKQEGNADNKAYQDEMLRLQRERNKNEVEIARLRALGDEAGATKRAVDSSRREATSAANSYAGNSNNFVSLDGDIVGKAVAKQTLRDVYEFNNLVAFGVKPEVKDLSAIPVNRLVRSKGGAKAVADILSNDPESLQQIVESSIKNGKIDRNLFIDNLGKYSFGMKTRMPSRAEDQKFLEEVFIELTRAPMR
jgi:hypothetical protein